MEPVKPSASRPRQRRLRVACHALIIAWAAANPLRAADDAQEALVLRASRAFESARAWPVPHPALLQSLGKIG